MCTHRCSFNKYGVLPWKAGREITEADQMSMEEKVEAYESFLNETLRKHLK